MPERMQKHVTARIEVIADSAVTVLTPRHGATGSRIVYYHGGAFVRPLLGAHWTMIAALIRRTGAEVWLPDYPLLFGNDVSDTLPLIDGLDERVAASLPDGARYIVAGDSAGGNLALVHALRAREAGRRAADRLLLFAPWVDVRLTSPESAEIEKLDVMLSVAPLRAYGSYWAGERDTSDPMVSPGLMASPGSMPPMTVMQGGHDLLLPDVRSFVEKVVADGGEAEYIFNPTGFHVYMGTTLSPEGRSALRLAAARVRG